MRGNSLELIAILLSLVYVSNADYYHSVKSTLEVMADFNESLITPAPLAGPNALPVSPIRLACRATRLPSHKPPSLTKAYSQFEHLPPLPDSLPSCTRPLNFSTQLTEGTWVKSPAAGAEFVLPTCRLRQLQADEALTCLKDRHIAWIGDSVTRFQVMSLVFWLGNDGYQDPLDHDQELGRPPTVCFNSFERNWTEYYSYLKVLFNDGACLEAKCDPCSHEHGREHWGFRFALDGGASTRVSLIVNLHAGAGQSVNALNHLLNRTSPTFTTQPDVLVFNLGIWMMMGGHDTRKDALMHFLQAYEVIFQKARLLVDAQPPPRTRLVFRASGLMGGGDQARTKDGQHHDKRDFQLWYLTWVRVEPVVKQMALFYGFDYYDVNAPQRALMYQGLPSIDWMHLHTYTNKALNDLLLNILC